MNWNSEHFLIIKILSFFDKNGSYGNNLHDENGRLCHVSFHPRPSTLPTCSNLVTKMASFQFTTTQRHKIRGNISWKYSTTSTNLGVKSFSQPKSSFFSLKATKQEYTFSIIYQTFSQLSKDTMASFQFTTHKHKIREALKHFLKVFPQILLRIQY